MKKALNDKQKLMAYVLNKDPDLGNHSTKKIGDFFKVAQSTAYNAVKDVGIARQIQNLQKELEETKTELLASKEHKKPDLIQIASRVTK
jgi:hypothetical protein